LNITDIGISVRVCRKCHLCESRRNAVPYDGSPAPKVVFIGEAPGETEDQTGRPFTGTAGKLLRDAITELGLKPDEYGITNTLKCRPPNNNYDDYAASVCRYWLLMELKSLTPPPKLFVAVGKKATEQLGATADGFPAKLSVVALSGRLLPQPFLGVPVFVLLHPAATFRDEHYKDVWANGIRTLKNRLATA
jgi:DNA polymerase